MDDENGLLLAVYVIAANVMALVALVVGGAIVLWRRK